MSVSDEVIDAIDVAAEQLFSGKPLTSRAAGILISEIARAAVHAMRTRGETPEQIIERLRRMDPYNVPWPKGARESDGRK
jgi:hypothetical protein